MMAGEDAMGTTPDSARDNFGNEFSRFHLNWQQFLVKQIPVVGTKVIRKHVSPH